jgi:hypothetical protein
MTLVWLCLMLAWLWPSEPTASPPSLAQPVPPPRKRSKEPKPLTVLTCKPHGAACEQASETSMLTPLPPRPKVTSTRGRQRHVATSQHCDDPCAPSASVATVRPGRDQHSDVLESRPVRGSGRHPTFPRSSCQMTMSLRCDVQSNAIHRSTQYEELSWARRSYNTSIGSHEVRALNRST